MPGPTEAAGEAAGCDGAGPLSDAVGDGDGGVDGGPAGREGRADEQRRQRPKGGHGFPSSDRIRLTTVSPITAVPPVSSVRGGWSRTSSPDTTGGMPSR
jgi:hypothetical protein